MFIWTLPEWGGLNAYQDGLGHRYIWVKMREKVPQSARLSAGRGCKSYLGNAQVINLSGASLTMR